MTENHPGRVGLLAPMPSEMKPLAKALALREDGKQTYRGSIGAIELVAGRTGVGTKRATEATQRLLDAEVVDHLVVSGIAGGMGPSKVGDVLFPAVVVDKVTRTEYTPTPLG